MNDENKNGIMGSLEDALAAMPQGIAGARKNGRKAVGYFCPYMPEELILAAGMLPLRLSDGGDGGPFYGSVDAFCVVRPCEDSAESKESLERRYKAPVFLLEMPATHDDYDMASPAVASFKKGLGSLSRELEKLSGNRISSGGIRRALALCQAVREKLRALYEYPRRDASPIEWRELYRVSQIGALIDRRGFLAELVRLDAVLRQRIAAGLPEDTRPRLMVAGAVSRKVMDAVRQAGGNIVTDGLGAASLLLRKRVPVFGPIENPFDSLAEQYLYNAPSPGMDNLPRKRSRILETVRDFRVHGLVYLKYPGSFEDEARTIKDTLYKELLVPTLLLEPGDAGAATDELLGKISPFIDIIGGRV